MGRELTWTAWGMAAISHAFPCARMQAAEPEPDPVVRGCRAERLLPLKAARLLLRSAIGHADDRSWVDSRVGLFRLPVCDAVA